jgi:LPS export ABC transporter protein LptC
LHIKQSHTPRKVNIFLFAVIILLISLILIAFIRHKIILKNTKAPLPPENTEATLSIKKFHHTATKKGDKQWFLEADSAQFFSEENMARLTDISVTFYLKDDQNIFLRANKGQLNTKTNDMTISGNVVVTMPQYILKTENLNYHHQSHIVNINSPVKITGSSMALTADTMSYEMKSGTLKCIGNVEGTFLENFAW